MSQSRRRFIRELGVAGGTLAALPFMTGRGAEAMTAVRRMPPRTSHPADMVARTRLVSQGAIQLDSNENPYGASLASQNAVKSSLPNAAVYPYEFVEALRTSIAEMHKADPNCVLVGSGSSEILRMALYAFVSPTRHLVTAAPTYEDPAYYAGLLGADVNAVPVDAALGLDTRRMATAARGAGLVFFCNPNNPTGTLHPPAAVSDFVRAVRQADRDAVVLIDEAYHEYVEDPVHKSALPLAVENRNVILSRTFSKAFGLAGLRIGYAVAHPETINEMLPHRLVHGVNLFGASAAYACARDEAHLRTQRRLNSEARQFTKSWFESAGYIVTPSHANYLMVNIRRETGAFQYDCADFGVLVGRPFPPLNTYSRISIGTLDEMRRATEVFKRVLARR